MIRFAGQDQFGAFVEWLNSHYPAPEPVTLVVLPGYDSIADDSGAPAGWGAYTPETRVIWLPGELPPVDDAERVALECLAHEYVHHLQECEGRGPDEDEAERRAREMVAEFLATQGGVSQ